MKPSISRRRLLQRGVFGGAGALLAGTAGGAGASAPGRVGGIVFMVSDGMSHGVISLAEAFSLLVRKKPTRWWQLMQEPAAVLGLMDTASADSLVTDSAAASSAWGSGTRVPNGSINVTAEGRQLEPIAATLAARSLRTGLVTTATVTHATPAGFAANAPDRGAEESIAPQYLGRVDIVLGGGTKFFDPARRRDKRNLHDEFAKAGYAVARSRDELAAARGRRLLGTFASGHLPFSVDRDQDPDLAKTVPTLAEMARAALARMLDGPSPFLLQVEGARIDHAAHANDIAGLLWDQLAFDDAIAAVLAMVASRRDILVVITSDHGNANPGLNGMGASYRRTNHHFAKIAAITASHEQVLELWNRRRSGLAEFTGLVESKLGFRPTEAEATAMLETTAGRPVTEWNHLLANPPGILGQIAGNHTGIGWTGTAHTADPTQLVAVGPAAERFGGLVRNDAVHRLLLDLLCG